MKKTLSAVCLLPLAAAAIGLTVSGSALAKCDKGEMVIKFSHVTNTDKHREIAATLLAKRVNAEMNGKACMQVFPNTLYDDNKVLEALLLEMSNLLHRLYRNLKNLRKKFRLFDLPFMFKDINAVDRFQNSAAGTELKDSMTRRGLKGLAFWHNGMKQMSANRPLVNPTDAKGLKFRRFRHRVLVANSKHWVPIH